MANARLSRLSLPFDGQRLRQHRELAGLTLVELSKRCEEIGKDTTPPTSADASTINRWELGKYAPSKRRLLIVAKALKVDVKSLCAEPEPK